MNQIRDASSFTDSDLDDSNLCDIILLGSPQSTTQAQIPHNQRLRLRFLTINDSDSSQSTTQPTAQIRDSVFYCFSA
jgi:hypothetical protein